VTPNNWPVTGLTPKNANRSQTASTVNAVVVKPDNRQEKIRPYVQNHPRICSSKPLQPAVFKRLYRNCSCSLELPMIDRIHCSHVRMKIASHVAHTSLLQSSVWYVEQDPCVYQLLISQTTQLTKHNIASAASLVQAVSVVFRLLVVVFFHQQLLLMKKSQSPKSEHRFHLKLKSSCRFTGHGCCCWVQTMTTSLSLLPFTDCLSRFITLGAYANKARIARVFLALVRANSSRSRPRQHGCDFGRRCRFSVSEARYFRTCIHTLYNVLKQYSLFE